MVALLKGLDVLVTLPTGFGKSLIFRIPAMLRERSHDCRLASSCPHGRPRARTYVRTVTFLSSCSTVDCALASVELRSRNSRVVVASWS